MLKIKITQLLATFASTILLNLKPSINVFLTGNFPSEWVSSEPCTYHFGWLCVSGTCFVTCYQYENQAIQKTWPIFERLVDSSYGAISESEFSLYEFDI